MTQQQLQSQRRASMTGQPTNQPMFFYDGNFRTWAQVEHRAQLNQTIARMTTTSRSR
ncbi:MAG: hypothetical protein QF898_05890 [SAR202 cluster bacterium]|jgi:hypothetical protein|nr:hypothetical protein [SAR202 cluster bacterium]